MMFEFTKEQEMLRAMVREFAETELAPRVLEQDSKEEFPLDIAKRLGEQGIIGLVSAKEYGGSGMGHVAALIATEELARIYPSIAFFLEVSHTSLFALEHFGTEEQKKKYMPPIIKGEKITSFAGTEASGGSSPANMATEAVADDDGYMINGRKVYISNGGLADYCILLAKSGEKSSMLMVEKGAPGFIVSRRQAQTGLRSLDVSELAFNDCKVPRDNLIGEDGGGLRVALPSFSTGRFSIGAVGLGIARGAFDIALKYAKERIMYGAPITNLQAIQFLLVDMETQIDAAKWLVYYPASRMDNGIAPLEVRKYCARAKIAGVQAGVEVSQKAMEILGGYGLSPEYRLPGLLNDALELVPANGTIQINKVIQAIEIIK
ncbi:acyl-CoA dehydrogenase family protein [Thermodesulfobacteriota bacterium]